MTRREMMRKARLAKFIWYSLVVLLGGVVVWGGYTDHWDIAIGSLIFGQIIVYLLYSVIAWLLGLPKVELPSDTGGGVPVEEDRSWVSDPSYSCIPGNYYYSETTCDSSSISSSSLDD